MDIKNMDDVYGEPPQLSPVNVPFMFWKTNITNIITEVPKEINA